LVWFNQFYDHKLHRLEYLQATHLYEHSSKIDKMPYKIAVHDKAKVIIKKTKVYNCLLDQIAKC